MNSGRFLTDAFLDAEGSFFTGGGMSTLLLIFCLALSGNNSCAGRHNRNTPRASSQADVAVLDPLLEQVNSCDDPTVRVFLRLKIAAYLWGHPSGSLRPESVAEAALADLRAHEKDMPALYADQFRKELLAQLKAHAPNSPALATEGDKTDHRTDIEVAYSLLAQDGGADKAVGIVQRSIIGGKDPGMVIVPFLHRLEKVNADDVPKVLDAIMSAEESRQGSISAGTLFRLKHLFIREQTPQQLQRRYLAAVINRAGDVDASRAAVVDTYTVLADVLPVVEKQSPDLYNVASARLVQLAGRVPSGTLEHLSVEKRVSQSSDPLGQLIAEADAANDPSLKEDLRVEAAQLALENGQPRTAIELVIGVDPKTDDAWLWRDQFIDGAVDRALDQGNMEVARYGTDQIHSAIARSSALEKIALHLQASSDPAGARDTLNAALKIIKASEDSADKAVALLNLATSYMKVDSQQATELVRTAIKTINNTAAAARKVEANGDTHPRDVENVMKIAYRIVPAFQTISAVDEYGALELAKDIQRRELRIAATLGAYTAQSAADKK
jgi:hypothetical protein